MSCRPGRTSDIFSGLSGAHLANKTELPIRDTIAQGDQPESLDANAIFPANGLFLCTKNLWFTCILSFCEDLISSFHWHLGPRVLQKKQRVSCTQSFWCVHLQPNGIHGEAFAATSTAVKKIQSCHRRLQNGLWFQFSSLESTEIAEHRKQTKTRPNSFWNFRSFSHISQTWSGSRLTSTVTAMYKLWNPLAQVPKQEPTVRNPTGWWVVECCSKSAKSDLNPWSITDNTHWKASRDLVSVPELNRFELLLRQFVGPTCWSPKHTVNSWNLVETFCRNHGFNLCQLWPLWGPSLSPSQPPRLPSQRHLPPSLRPVLRLVLRPVLRSPPAASNLSHLRCLAEMMHWPRKKAHWITSDHQWQHCPGNFNCYSTIFIISVPKHTKSPTMLKSCHISKGRLRPSCSSYFKSWALAWQLYNCHSYFLWCTIINIYHIIYMILDN